MFLNQGTKIYKYENDELKTLRIKKCKSNKYVCVDINDKSNSVILTEETRKDYITLTPDAILNIMIASINNEKDIFVCVHRLQDMSAGSSVPALILRQDVYSLSKNVFNTSNITYVGDCLTINTCEESEYKEFFKFNNIDEVHSIALYIDDAFDDICDLINNNHRITKITSEVLSELKDKYETPNVEGYCESITELMETNNFMYNFRSLFNILTVDFEIELDNNVSEDGIVTLNAKQINRIEDILRQYITNVNVLKYDKDIDVGSIVSHSHLMVCDKNNNIYLISYTSTGSYPVDDDIAFAMGLK